MDAVPAVDGGSNHARVGAHPTTWTSTSERAGQEGQQIKFRWREVDDLAIESDLSRGQADLKCADRDAAVTFSRKFGRDRASFMALAVVVPLDEDAVVEPGWV